MAMEPGSAADRSTKGAIAKLPALRERIAGLGGALVSYSGGVDSALLAVVAREVLGERMVGAFLDGPLVPRRAAAEAHEIAARHGLPLVVIPFDPRDHPLVAANPTDRCYQCKKAIASLLEREAAARGLPAVVDGVTCSDLGEHRPGLVACAEAGIGHPFVDAGIGKEEVRAIARALGLDFAGKPSSACLASRIPYGEPLAPALLAAIEEAEEALHGLGLSQVRVRAHGRVARVEVPPADFGTALVAAPRVVAALKAAGFAYATLDLEGYRTGAMDEAHGKT
jgi:uncharacterized protein